MKNDWRVEIVRQRLALAYDVVAALKIKSSRSMSQQLRVPDDYRHAGLADIVFGNGF